MTLPINLPVMTGKFCPCSHHYIVADSLWICNISLSSGSLAHVPSSVRAHGGTGESSSPWLNPLQQSGVFLPRDRYGSRELGTRRRVTPARFNWKAARSLSGLNRGSSWQPTGGHSSSAAVWVDGMSSS